MKRMIIFVLFTLMCKIAKTDQSTQAKDYCVMEAFKPECRPNEVILMKNATYGRMQIGGCVSAEEVAVFGQDKNNLGCFSDVLTIMDNKCSGKTSCEIRIPDNDLESTKPCYPGLKMYLKADYECVTVIERDDRSSCNIVATSSLQHLRIIKSQYCGSSSKPWIIESSLGKTIHLGLFNFHASVSKTNSNRLSPLTPVTCSKLGYVIDKTAKKQETICNTNARFRTLFNSIGNVIEVTFTDVELSSESLLLRFKAIGCSDIIPAEDSWIKRDGHSLNVGCYSSRKTWTLTCRDDKWIGVVGNCSQDPDITQEIGHEGNTGLERTGKMTMSAEHQTLVIVTIIGFGIAVCLTIICAGAICVRRCYSSKNISEGFSKGDASYYNATVTMPYPLTNNGDLSNFADQNGHIEQYEESKYFVLDQTDDKNIGV